jgi:hypothetical protein
MNGPDNYKTAAERTQNVIEGRSQLDGEELPIHVHQAFTSACMLDLMTALVHAVQANTAATVHLTEVVHSRGVDGALDSAAYERHLAWAEVVS